jgi:sulfide:quinone oxidoreductase
MHTDPRPAHVVIAGGGVAAVECALALHDLAGDRVRMTIVAPNAEFELRALRTAEPFSRDHVRRHALVDLAERVGAELIAASVEKVRPGEHRLVAGGRTIGYDALVVAVGGRHRTAYSRALTFTGDTSTIDYNGLLADVDEGYAHTISFVVPPGTTWSLPIYELALMTAREGWGMGMSKLRLAIVTPEAAPLALFGPQAGAAMQDLLDQAGIAFRGGAYVREGAGGKLTVLPGGEPLDSQRVVALPTIEGPGIEGLPADDHGFLPVDAHGRVSGCEDVYAAGDGTTFAVKQGGIACQQADAIAEILAAATGAPVDPQPFRPVLRGRVLAGRGAQYLEHALHGGAGESAPPELRLWSATHKVDGRYLSPWLEELEGQERRASGDGEAQDAGAVEVEIRVPLSLDPYSPVAG